jgi:hypothetical protein
MASTTFDMSRVLAAYIPIPPSHKFSDETPPSGVVIYGFGCIVTLLLMYLAVQKVRKQKRRKKHAKSASAKSKAGDRSNAS